LLLQIHREGDADVSGGVLFWNDSVVPQINPVFLLHKCSGWLIGYDDGRDALWDIDCVAELESVVHVDVV
jgi:hypothetical protein